MESVSKGSRKPGRVLPILHARLHALFTGGRHALNRELSQAASNHRDRSELAAGARVGAVGVLSVEPVLRVAAYPPTVVRTHERHLHPDFGRSCPNVPVRRI